VLVVNYPLLYLAERIAGEQATLELPVPRDVDPAYWSPEPEAIARFQQADLILLNGAGYAGWIRTASLPTRTLTDTASAFPERLITLEAAPVHQHGPAGEHSHAATAFTLWLDPTLAAEQARAIAQALASTRPEHAAGFSARLRELEQDLEALDRRLDAIARRIGDEPLLFSHPVYAYLERRYGLQGRSLHWEPDEVPDARMWRELERLLDEQPARWMVWESRPLPQTRDRLASLGVSSVIFDPCANVPASGDYLSVMRANAERLERGPGLSGS
jgi:zinc transport system substrate-binding protein